MIELRIERPVFLKLRDLHDHFAQVSVGYGDAHIFRGHQPEAVVDELFDHELLDRFILELSRHFFFVEAVHVFVGAPKLIARDGQVADCGNGVSRLVPESPPAHGNHKGNGQDAHD